MNTYDSTNFHEVRTGNELNKAPPWFKTLDQESEYALPKEGTSRSAKLTKANSERETKLKSRP